MFKRIHQVFISLNNPTKFPYSRSIDVEVHCAVIEYENKKTKLAHYLIRLTDLEDVNDQCQEWFPERQGVVNDPTLARAIEFFNIYHQMWESIERGKILMHCENTTFIYHDEFNKYIKVDGATSEEIFDYLFNFSEPENSYQNKKRNINMNCLNGIQNTLKMMKTLMMDLKTMLEIKPCRISRITSLVTLKSCSTSI